MDMNSLSHTKWECKYHIVFAPKFRRKVAYGQLKADIANILSTLCKRKGVEIIEAEVCPDHIHSKRLVFTVNYCFHIVSLFLKKYAKKYYIIKVNDSIGEM